MSNNLQSPTKTGRVAAILIIETSIKLMAYVICLVWIRGKAMDSDTQLISIRINPSLLKWVGECEERRAGVYGSLQLCCLRNYPLRPTRFNFAQDNEPLRSIFTDLTESCLKARKIQVRMFFALAILMRSSSSKLVHMDFSWAGVVVGLGEEGEWRKTRCQRSSCWGQEPVLSDCSRSMCWGRYIGDASSEQKQLKRQLGET